MRKLTTDDILDMRARTSANATISAAASSISSGSAVSASGPS